MNGYLLLHLLGNMTEEELNSFRIPVESVEELQQYFDKEKKIYQEMLDRITKATGIDDPLNLIQYVRNETDTYVDALVNYIEIQQFNY